MSVSPHQGRERPMARITTEAATDAFTGRIMAAVLVQPTPTPTRTLLAAVRRRSPRDAGAALSVAWHLATVRRWTVAAPVRVRSMALVFAVAGVLGMGSLAAAATVRTVAEPIGQFFQSGVDEQGPAEHQTPGPDGMSGAQDADAGVDQPATRDGADESGASGHQSRTDEPAADRDGNDGQSGTDESGANGDGDRGNNVPSGTSHSGPDTSGRNGDGTAAQSRSDGWGANDDENTTDP